MSPSGRRKPLGRLLPPASWFMSILTPAVTRGSRSRLIGRLNSTPLSSVSRGGSPGGKPAVGLVLNWNGPKTGVTEYRRKWRDWEKAFELAWAKRSRRWNGEGAFIFPREVIPAEARAADLVIIGSHPVRDDVYRAFDPGTVILNAGRPVLVVPDAAAGSSGARVLVAWKDTREARHAVQSALPYLKVAKHVSLVEIAEGVLEWAARSQLDDVEKYLLRHGVKVSGKSVLTPEGLPADQLMNIARGDGVDLIVAGAYGHTRLGEWVFGGVTRGLLERSDICCLFSN